MATRKKAAPLAWSFAEALEHLKDVGSGPADESARAMITAGRTLAEHDALAAAIGDDAQGRWLLHRLAQADHDAAKAARLGGEPIPARPYLDELTRRNATMTSTRATTTRASGGGATRTPKASGIRFTHDGKLVAASQNKLSSVAWFYTKPLGGGGGRMKVKELLDALKKLGVSDPNVAGWSVTLPNGVTLGAVKDGETPKPVDKPKAEKAAKATKTTAKKSTATKAPAKAKPTPKKQTAKAKAASTSAPSKLAPDNRTRKATAKKSAVAARKITRRVTRKV